MKNKASLSLMEQLCMLLVFALSAALCLQIFVLSSQLSRRSEARAQAAGQVQTTAEILKYCKGDSSLYPQLLGGSGDEKLWQLSFDENWDKTGLEQASYRIVITFEDSGPDTLGRAKVSALSDKGDELFSLTVSWQEVAHE